MILLSHFYKTPFGSIFVPRAFVSHWIWCEHLISLLWYFDNEVLFGHLEVTTVVRVSTHVVSHHSKVASNKVIKGATVVEGTATHIIAFISFLTQFVNRCHQSIISRSRYLIIRRFWNLVLLVIEIAKYIRVKFTIIKHVISINYTRWSMGLSSIVLWYFTFWLRKVNILNFYFSIQSWILLFFVSLATTNRVWAVPYHE